ncbi:PREDICTED: pentatricopeptide repeat-containing protein At5g15010, mitochondrial isoform X2 [Tarenaya hassleriana]|uniref:pentatricopeptide repeat-containing protein At5g15010, mitochondrial isoform X2 n=1 Tax=Tarenaya hassleriana TaxID=28532 RepID=UPI00053C136B|nr:PREDICTED: pentatricopeptide repeat-containing protein At5g15010, mitochondrial isoform X2 [Tarenaya hassleriana]
MFYPRFTGQNRLDNEEDDDKSEEDDDDDDNLVMGKSGFTSDEGLLADLERVLVLLKACGNNRAEMRSKLDQCDVKPSSELVVEVLSRVRNDWETAFTFFLWAGKQPGYVRSVHEYHSMISILGKMRKFDTAWTLIDEMRRCNPSLLAPQTLLIMIRKYCAVHNVGKAINTFYTYKRFKFDLGIDDFQHLLSALCRYKNVEDAEHLMHCNKATYAFSIKSFNIILNGWCNVIGNPREGERVWQDMGKRGIRHDVVSYASMISCHSKAGNLNKVFRLFDQMKKHRIEPDRKVYIAVVHALAKAGFVSDATNLMKTMAEKGIELDVAAYNSLLKPLCKARKTDEARRILNEMVQKGISPKISTYHAVIRVLRTGEEVFDLLEEMRKTECKPNIDTYTMLIRKLCRWHDFGNVFRLWDEMKETGTGPDRSSYIVMIHGLFLNGKIEEAYGYYTEMKEKGLETDKKVEDMIQSWFSGKQFAEKRMRDLERSETECLKTGLEGRSFRKLSEREENFLRQPQVRRVVRERGFSFWEE